MFFHLNLMTLIITRIRLYTSSNGRRAFASETPASQAPSLQWTT